MNQLGVFMFSIQQQVDGSAKHSLKSRERQDRPRRLSLNSFQGGIESWDQEKRPRFDQAATHGRQHIRIQRDLNPGTEQQPGDSQWWIP